MCVILYCDTNRPTPKQVKQAFEKNPEGAGIAWRDGKEVVWRKGLTEAEILKACASVPLPFTAHFRIASMNQTVVPRLCHPFPLTERVETVLTGRTENGVLFHNGSWTSWRTIVMDAVIRSGKSFPTDLWSDTRALAWMAHHFGLGILELINEKVIVFGPGEVEFFGDPWYEVEIPGSDTKMWASNKLWMETTAIGKWVGGGYFGGHGRHASGDSYYHQPIASLGQTRGSAQETPFRGKEGADGGPSDGDDRAEKVSTGDEATGGVGGEGTEGHLGQTSPSPCALIGNEFVGGKVEENGEDIHEWACGINSYPKGKKPHVRLKANDDQDRARREALQRRGIEIIGPL